MADKGEALSERETILRWDGHRDTVSVFTASPAVHRKLERAGYGVRKTSTRKGQVSGWFYHIPYPDLRWTARPRQKRASSHGFRPQNGGPKP